MIFKILMLALFADTAKAQRRYGLPIVSFLHLGFEGWCL